MSTAPDRIHRSLADLSGAERERLEEAHRRLRVAVETYQRFEGVQQNAADPVPVHDSQAMAQAQAEAQAAESELWRVREELLGWARPAWAPSATQVADWFSDEDRVYDEFPTAPTA